MLLVENFPLFRTKTPVVDGEVTPATPTVVAEPLTKHQRLVDRYYALRGRYLLAEEAAELRHIADLLGVKLEWTRTEFEQNNGSPCFEVWGKEERPTGPATKGKGRP